MMSMRPYIPFVTGTRAKRYPAKERADFHVPPFFRFFVPSFFFFWLFSFYLAKEALPAFELEESRNRQRRVTRE